MKKGPYYWIDSKSNLGRKVSFGDPLPADIPENRINDLIAAGKISDKKPANPNEARADALAQMREQNEKLTAKNIELFKKAEMLEISNKNLKTENQQLKDQLGKLKNSDSENEDLKSQIEELQAELEDVPKNVRAANQKIKKLESEISELTKPGGK